MRYTWMPSPVGPLLLAADGEGLRLVEFHAPRHPMPRTGDWREGDNDVLAATRLQLEEYFAGTRQAFELPLAPRGTEFQRAVWWMLAKIPYGETISYAQLATRVAASTSLSPSRQSSPLGIGWRGAWNSTSRRPSSSAASSKGPTGLSMCV